MWVLSVVLVKARRRIVFSVPVPGVVFPLLRELPE